MRVDKICETEYFDTIITGPFRNYMCYEKHTKLFLIIKRLIKQTLYQSTWYVDSRHKNSVFKSM